MANPLERLKRLPWKSLAQATILTVIVVSLLEFGIFLLAQVASLRPVLMTLFLPPLGIVTMLAIALGVGALAVLLLERVDRFSISTSSLWALILCLAVAFLLRQLFPLPFGIFSIDYPQFVTMVVGVFWKGRPYWKSFRRW